MWSPPPGTLCSEEGCTLTPTGVRPSAQDYIIEQGDASPLIFAAGTVLELACAVHGGTMEETDA